MMHSAKGAAMALTLALLGCSSATTSKPTVPLPEDAPGRARVFENALLAFRDADAKGTWNPETCASVAEGFEPFFDDHGAGSEARFNAAVTELRCSNTARAEEILSAALTREPGFARARWLLAVTDDSLGDDRRIAELERAAADATFNDPVILLALGRAQLARRSSAADDDGANDLERAAKNFRRALAVDDDFAPAISDLALTLMLSGRRAVETGPLTRAPEGPRARGDAQTLEMVHLMASQGLRKHPSYAPLHNTLGLVLFELGDSSGAIAAFNKARELQPDFLDAHLNAAAVNLSFRGFDRAESAFRAALAIREDYDSLLGLALALRGRADDASARPDEASERLAQAAAVLEKAKKLAPSRPEAHFNHAVLLEIYGDRMGGDRGPAAAIAEYWRFVELAKGDAKFAQDVDAVTAVPTKTDAECLGERAKDDRACARGRLFDLQQLLEEAGS